MSLAKAFLLYADGRIEAVEPEETGTKYIHREEEVCASCKRKRRRKFEAHDASSTRATTDEDTYSMVYVEVPL